MTALIRLKLKKTQKKCLFRAFLSFHFAHLVFFRTCTKFNSVAQHEIMRYCTTDMFDIIPQQYEECTHVSASPWWQVLALRVAVAMSEYFGVERVIYELSAVWEVLETCCSPVKQPFERNIKQSVQGNSLIGKIDWCWGERLYAHLAARLDLPNCIQYSIIYTMGNIVSQLSYLYCRSGCQVRLLGVRGTEPSNIMGLILIGIAEDSSQSIIY